MSATASNLSPNLWSRGPGVTSYIVYPIDPTQIVETAKTGAALKALANVVSVSPNRRDDDELHQVVYSWDVTSADSSDLKITLGAVEGVRAVQQKPQANQTTVAPSLLELKRRDIQNYTALANLTEDVQKTEEFLKSKVQSGTKIASMKNGDKLVGWWQLSLAPDAFKAVKDYVGIKAIRATEEGRNFRVLPPDDQGNLPRQAGEEPVDEQALSRRAEQWEKQKDADKALNMDSQFR